MFDRVAQLASACSVRAAQPPGATGEPEPPFLNGLSLPGPPPRTSFAGWTPEPISNKSHTKREHIASAIADHSSKERAHRASAKSERKERAKDDRLIINVINVGQLLRRPKRKHCHPSSGPSSFFDERPGITPYGAIPRTTSQTAAGSTSAHAATRHADKTPHAVSGPPPREKHSTTTTPTPTPTPRR